MPPPEPQTGRSLGTPPIQPRKPFLSTDSNPIHHDFPGGPLVKNPPSNAGDVGSTPGRRIKIPQATQLSQKKKKKALGSPLVVQWLRIHLPMQETWVRFLGGELRSPHVSEQLSPSTSTRGKPACCDEDTACSN